MSTTASANDNFTRDPFELNRLAEELAVREATSNSHLEQSSTEVDLPELQPLSHDNTYLSAPDFNVEEFLLSRSNTSLPDIRTELREYLAQLKEELVRLINDDYEAFISLSTDLQGEGERLERIKWPLGELRSQIKASRSQLQEVQDSIKSKLERRASLREEKALLQLLLKISDSITRLESLLLISSPHESIGPDKATYSERSRANDISDEKSAKGNRAKHLLRIASEYNQLIYHAGKASNSSCHFVEENQWRIERIKSTLSSDLEHHFAITLLSLTSSDKAYSGKARQPEAENLKLVSDLVDCLRAYDMLGLWRDAEDVVRREVVRAFVKKTIYPGCLSGPRSPMIPATPFSQLSYGSSSNLRPPPTPYTPYTAFWSKQDPFFSNPIDLDSSTCLLDDSDNPLAGLYNQVLRFISRDMKPIMEAAERVGSKSSRSSADSAVLSMNVDEIVDESEIHGFDILSNVIWAEVSRAIMDDLGSLVFAAGKPDDFRKNYETTQAFILSFEYVAPSMQSVKLFRRHPALEAFERRWQLPVYFQLRWKDIVGSVEEALESRIVSSRSNSTKSANRNAFVMGQSAAIWDAITQCWSTEIYLPNLGPRFWRLTLQLLKRYGTWIESSMPPLESSMKKTPVVDKGSGPGLPSSRSSTPVPHQDTPSVDRTTEDDKYLHQCSMLMQDIKEMERATLQLWKDQISVMFPQNIGDEDQYLQLENALESALSSVTNILPQLSSQVEMILTRRCCDALAPVKSLPGQFRATSQKHTPTKPSSFVPLILRPVKLFFGVDTGEGDAKALRKDFCVSMSTGIVEAVSNRYISHLIGMRKTEESLRRLRMGKKTGFSLFGGSSSNDEDIRDEERVRAQLILDVRAFGKEAEALGVKLETCTSFKALEHLVNTNPGDVEVSS